MAARKGRTNLADLADDSTLTALPDPTVPRSVAVDALTHNPRNPRYDYTDVQELADSLSTAGQKQAIGVVPREVYLAHYPNDDATIGTADYVVITGNRRLAAARHAGLLELRVTVDTTLADAAAVPESALIENIHRADLPPLLEARELQALVSQHGGQRALATRISKSQGWISQRLALLKLTTEFQDRLRNGELSVDEARAIAGKPHDEQEHALEQLRATKAFAAEPPTTKSEQMLPEYGHVPERKPARVGSTRSVRVTTNSIDAAARDLRAAFPPSQLAELVTLLSED